VAAVASLRVAAAACAGLTAPALTQPPAAKRRVKAARALALVRVVAAACVDRTARVELRTNRTRAAREIAVLAACAVLTARVREARDWRDGDSDDGELSANG